MDKAQLEANIAGLAERWPDLARDLAAIGTLSFPEITVRISESGRPYLVWRLGARLIDLDDPRDPARAAKNQIAALKLETELVLLEGIGLGYQLKALLARKSLKHVIVVEPQLALFALALSITDFRRAFADPRVELFVAKSAGDVASWMKNRFNYGTDRRNLLILLPHYERIVHPLIAASPEFATAFQRLWSEATTLSDRNRRTLGTFVDHWRRNLLENIPLILEGGMVADLAGAAHRTAGFLVGAGPSLDRNVHRLRQAQGRSVIVAVDTAYRTLRAHGVTPDIVIAVDATEANIRDFDGIERIKPPTALVMVPVVRPEIARLFERRYSASYGHPLQKWMEKQMGTLFGSLLVSGSVSTIGFDLLRYMKARPIVLVGMDLAYTEAATHTKSYNQPPAGRFETMETRIHRSVASARHRHEGLNGGVVATTEQMMRWLEWFEKEMERVSWPVINATEGGATIRGAERLTLAEAVHRHARRSYALPAPHGVSDKQLMKMVEALERLAAGDRKSLDEILFWEEPLRSDDEMEKNRAEVSRIAGDLAAILRRGATG